jgi:hypothetical protein
MPPNRPHETNEHSTCPFRRAVRLVLVSSLLGLQGGCIPNNDSYEEWDDLKYLYEDIKNPEPDEPPAAPAKENGGTDGFDLLKEPDCDYNTCKFG